MTKLFTTGALFVLSILLAPFSADACKVQKASPAEEAAIKEEMLKVLNQKIQSGAKQKPEPSIEIRDFGQPLNCDKFDDSSLIYIMEATVSEGSCIGLWEVQYRRKDVATAPTISADLEQKMCM